VPIPPRPFERFVAALHRRLVLLRFLEKTGLGTLTGAAVAAAAISLLTWRGEPALVPTVAALALGAAVGFLWGLGHLPTSLDAAAEADRQLGLADLLGTACSIRSRPRESDRDESAEPWLATVLALADARCAGQPPSDVILRRLHARAWAGIALSAALVVSVAALVSDSPRAVAAGRRAAETVPTGADRPEARRAAGRPALPPSASAATPASPQEQSSPSPAGTTTDTSADASAATPPSDSGRRGTAADGGTGRGSAASRLPPRTAQPPAEPSSPAATPPATGVIPAGGAGSPATTPSAPDRSAIPGTTASSSATSAAPPWRTETWPADARRAGAAIDSGQIPAAHRDLVRDYFDRS
jgi:hypothetical protein